MTFIKLVKQIDQIEKRNQSGNERKVHCIMSGFTLIVLFHRERYLPLPTFRLTSTFGWLGVITQVSLVVKYYLALIGLSISWYPYLTLPLPK